MKKYKIIYADPPWSYRNDSNPGRSGAIDHYPTMDIESIKNFPVPSICDKDCILFLWVTFPLLSEALQVISSWGFVYKTCSSVWIKTNKRTKINQYSFLPQDNFDDFMGMGRWTRSNAEICLLSTRGNIKRVSAGVRQIIYSPIREHSRKPDETRERIIRLCGDLPRIELFARQETSGWDVWGNEVNNSIVID